MALKELLTDLTSGLASYPNHNTPSTSGGFNYGSSTSIFDTKMSINKVLELVYDKEKLEKYFKDNENSRELYNRNNLLIDFDMIPENIKNNINNLIEI